MDGEAGAAPTKPPISPLFTTPAAWFISTPPLLLLLSSVGCTAPPLTSLVTSGEGVTSIPGGGLLLATALAVFELILLLVLLLAVLLLLLFLGSWALLLLVLSDDVGFIALQNRTEIVAVFTGFFGTFYLQEDAGPSDSSHLRSGFK